MNIRLLSVQNTFTSKERQEYEKLGFQFKPADDENLKSGLYKIKKNPTIEIETLKELYDLSSSISNDLVIKHRTAEGVSEIIIYNDYLE